MSKAARPGLVLLTAIVISGCGTASVPMPSRPSQTGSAAPTQTGAPRPTQAGSSLPPCPSITATGCERSAIQARGRGSSGCQGKGPGTISASPIALTDLAFIQPMGLMAGGHVTPIDHGYFYTKEAVA